MESIIKAIHLREVEESAVVDAARAACEKLDVIFPGKDHGGITSHFQFLLEQLIGNMLAGVDPRSQRSGFEVVELPELVYRDESFGDPKRADDGTGFVVSRVCDDCLLNIEGTRFVPLTARFDGYFSSYRNAVDAAIHYLNRKQVRASAEGITVDLLSEWRESRRAPAVVIW